MKSEYRIWVRYFNYVSEERLFNEHGNIQEPCRRVVSELAWALDIVPRLPCSSCGKIMVFAPGSMAFGCECGKAKILYATSDESMRWHIEHWKDLNPKQTADDIEKYGKDEGLQPFPKEKEPRFGPVLMPDGTISEKGTSSKEM